MLFLGDYGISCEYFGNLKWRFCFLCLSFVISPFAAGNPPKLFSCVAQCILYVIVMVIEKALMTAVLLFDFWSKVRHNIFNSVYNCTCTCTFLYNLYTWPYWWRVSNCKCLFQVRDFILSPITDPSLEIVIVMFVVPFVVNVLFFLNCKTKRSFHQTLKDLASFQALIFWVVDNLVKKKAFISQASAAASVPCSHSTHYARASDSVNLFGNLRTQPVARRDSDLDSLLSLDETQTHANDFQSQHDISILEAQESPKDSVCLAWILILQLFVFLMLVFGASLV